MKHLALLTTAAAVLTMPMIASAGNYDHQRRTSNDMNKTYETTRVQKTYNYNKQNPDAALEVVTPENNIEAPQTFALEGINGSILIKGEKIYFVEPNGYKYFAPDGPYTTQQGVTYYSSNGVINLIEAPQEVVYIDADVLDTNRNGVYDDVDVDVRTRTPRYR